MTFNSPRLELKYTKTFLWTDVLISKLVGSYLLCLNIPFYLFLYPVLDIKLSLLFMIWTVKTDFCWVWFFLINTLSSSSMLHISISTNTKCSINHSLRFQRASILTIKTLLFPHICKKFLMWMSPASLIVISY